MRMQATELLVVGAGPTGLALALAAHNHGAHVRIVERRPEALRPSRALILYPRTLEVLRPFGVAEALLARADCAPAACLHLGSRVVRLRLDELALPDTAFPHLSLVRQMDVETVISEALHQRGIEVERGTEVIEVGDEDSSACATLRSSTGLEHAKFDFVAGADGPDSTVRGYAGIGWPGGPYRQEIMLADLELDTELDTDVAHAVAGRRGLLFLFALGESATWRLLATRPSGPIPLPYGQPGPSVPVSQLQALLDGAGMAARITELGWSARYSVQHRLATRFRRGRLYLVGDAAHAYSPATGQGMNMGIQDATNLGWKLAFARSSSDPASLLDSYDFERRPAARRTLALTHLAFWAEASTKALPSLLRGIVAPLGAPVMPALIKHKWLVSEVVRTMSQLRAAYAGSPLSVEGRPQLREGTRVGHRLPNVLVTSNGHRVQLHALLAQPGVHVLLQRDADDLERLQFGAQVTVHRLTSVPGTGLVTVRPDGYVGFRCGIGDVAQLRAWLARIGARSHEEVSKCAEHHERGTEPRW
jgi:2-polyprenyl-6-methoxyphenol hydroxylase-like FAD-dependent oxidoreductase